MGCDSNSVTMPAKPLANQNTRFNIVYTEVMLAMDPYVITGGRYGDMLTSATHKHENYI